VGKNLQKCRSHFTNLRYGEIADLILRGSLLLKQDRRSRFRINATFKRNSPCAVSVNLAFGSVTP